MALRDHASSDRRTFLRTATAALALSALPGLRPAFGAEPPLKIGIVGSGRIGSTLGEIWLKAGHEVMFSSRHLDKDRELAAKLGGKARAGTPKEAAAFGEVILMSVPYGALPQVGKDLAAEIRGKPIVDACNPFPHRDGEIATWAREKGAGDASAELLKGAHVVRAFNAVSWARLTGMAELKGADKVGMPIAGDDAKAVALAVRLVRDVGFEPVVVGGQKMGRYLMPGTPLAGERSADEVRKIAAGLK